MPGLQALGKVVYPPAGRRTPSSPTLATWIQYPRGAGSRYSTRLKESMERPLSPPSPNPASLAATRDASRRVTLLPPITIKAPPLRAAMFDSNVQVEHITTLPLTNRAPPSAPAWFCVNETKEASSTLPAVRATAPPEASAGAELSCMLQLWRRSAAPLTTTRPWSVTPSMSTWGAPCVTWNKSKEPLGLMVVPPPPRIRTSLASVPASNVTVVAREKV